MEKGSKKIVDGLLQKYDSVYAIARAVYRSSAGEEAACIGKDFEKIRKRWNRWAVGEAPPTAQMKLDLEALSGITSPVSGVQKLREMMTEEEWDSKWFEHLLGLPAVNGDPKVAFYLAEQIVRVALGSPVSEELEQILQGKPIEIKL